MGIKKEAFDLLREWCDTLIGYTIEIDTPYLNGSILCPACSIVHGRIGDLVLPLTYLYRETKDGKYLDAAKKYVAWSEFNLVREDGTYYNDVGSTWKGISAFSGLAIGETLEHFSDIIDEETRLSWEATFRRLAYSCAEYFDSPRFTPVINYYAGAAAFFALAYRYFGDEMFLDKARAWEARCHDAFDENGLLVGEGFGDRIKSLTESKHILGIMSDKGCRPIDMGYNLEESIQLLIMHSVWLGDEELIKYYVERAKSHIHFILPDGAIDNTFGSRHNKWTYWGSRTSDGLQEGFVLVAKGEPLIARACLENIRLYRRCTHNGALYAGLMCYSEGEPACIHHAFTHAKALAAFCLFADEADYEDCESTPFPRETDGVKSFQNGNVITVTRGGFIATVNAFDGIRYDEADNGGGAISMLYHKNYGAILAATPHKYVPVEPLNMQYLRHTDKTQCQTPRFVSEDRTYFSDTDRSVILKADGYKVSATSRECDFSAEYDFTEDGITVTVTSGVDGTYYLPVISECTDEFTHDGNTVTFRELLTVTAEGLSTELYHGRRFFNQIGGFQYVRVRIPVKANTPTVFTIKIK